MKRMAFLTAFLLLASLPGVCQAVTVRVEPPQHTARAGNQFQTVAHAQGGTPPYRYEWFVANERTGEFNQAKTWSLRNPGSYFLRVVARDSAGLTGEGSCQVEVQVTVQGGQSASGAGREGEKARVHSSVVP